MAATLSSQAASDALPRLNVNLDYDEELGMLVTSNK